MAIPYEAMGWVGGDDPRKRHLLECDYFSSPENLRQADHQQLRLPKCQWCIERINRSMGIETDNTVYRTRLDWLAAMGSAQGLTAGNPVYAEAVRVLVHLAWSGPKDYVWWNRKRPYPAGLVDNATSMGAERGTQVAKAIDSVLNALDEAADTDARKAAAAALRAATV